MDDRVEEDKKAVGGLNSETPHRKAHSYSQQHRASSGTHKQHNQTRKHSLDNDRTLQNAGSFGEDYDDEEELYTSSSGNTSAVADDSGGGGGGSGPDDLQTMPEFIASGGDGGVFRSPIRCAVHPTRPSCVELRPHPLKETQVGKFLRNIACTETQLWAGQECGVRVWHLENTYGLGTGLGGKVRRGDEDAAPFHESADTSPTTCLTIDNGNRLVWTGHKDGKIRSWKMDQTFDYTRFKEGLSWQAHRGPVLAIVMTSYGDLWSGADGGNIRVWPWESIQKSLSLSLEERHMAALLVERSYIDLRSQVTVNGVCNLSSHEVKCLLSDNVRSRVWCATPLSFSLWDSRTRELIKVFNIEGQLENRADVPTVQQDQSVEDEVKVKFVSTSKKEKSQSSFLQRSRNAILGAADAVRRVASKGTGAFVEDNKRTEALVLACDGAIWSGCTNGLLVQWDGNGTRLQDFNFHPCAVQCFCAFGTQIYVGYVSGIIQVIDLEGNLFAGWVAHSNPVIKLAVGGGYIFSLAAHGGIRGWSVTSPGIFDSITKSELAGKELTYTRRQNIRILMGTWNVGQGRASQESLMSWLGSVASDAGIIVVGLQEVEMGAGFLAMSAAKETVGLEGSAVGQWWLDTIGKAIEEGKTFERMGSRQLAGLLISLWVRKNLRAHVGDVDVAAVPCGFGRAIGNKGGVGIRIRVYDRIMCFVNCHLAAHLEAVNRRNADFDHIYKNMTFSRSSNLAAAGVSTAVPTIRSTNATGSNSEEPKPELSEADMVVFCGDFNYRLFGISYDEARDFVSQRCFDWLREKDQLREEMKNGKVFQGMREAIIKFPPTYKFERHQAGLGGYDSGEKKRIPAWCDRVIYRDSQVSKVSDSSLACPVVASILHYDACMDVTDSDHKPVRCKFNVKISHVDRSTKRKEFGEVVRSNEKIRAIFKELQIVPETSVSTNNIIIQNQDTSMLQLTNRSTNDQVIYKIVCEGQSTVKDGEPPHYCTRGAFGFPRWLEVTPAAGIIKPEQNVEISIRNEEFHTREEFVDGIPQNWWCEDKRDKEVILVVNVQGSCSMEISSHRIIVRRSFSAKTTRTDSKSSSSRKNQGGSSNRAETHQYTSSSDNVLESQNSKKS